MNTYIGFVLSYTYALPPSPPYRTDYTSVTYASSHVDILSLSEARYLTSILCRSIDIAVQGISIVPKDDVRKTICEERKL